MDTAEALRSIRYDLVEYIQKNITVDFNNALQIPVRFMHQGKRYIVYEILVRIRLRPKSYTNGFLVKAGNEEVYFLYFKELDGNRRNHFNKGFWVLSFRILSDRELMAFYRKDRKMLVDNMTLKKLIKFHGRLCPELVIGAKVCEYARKLFSRSGKLGKGISVIAENCTSALDAIQVLLGATAGNQRLKVLDLGKHNYTFLLKDEKYGFRLLLRDQQYGDEYEYQMIEDKIMKERMSLDELVHFQVLSDNRIKRLLASPIEGLFSKEPFRRVRPDNVIPAPYLS